ncbi:MAG: hypothetical protein PHZ03_03535 [Syntrophomonas sp.]|nr:hypothetical protein [Syntrophomonas sp.]
MIIAVSLAYLGIIFIQVPYMVKNALWPELAAFSFLLVLAMVYSFGLLLNWQLPNLIDGLKLLFIPVTQFMEQMLG